jgi:hypothetical protein
MNRIWLATLMLGVACGQTPNTQGTINGRPLGLRADGLDVSRTRSMAENRFKYQHNRAPGPADEQSVAAEQRNIICGRITQAVMHGAREQAVIDYKISPTQADLEKARPHVKYQHSGDPVTEAKETHDQTAAVLAALEAVDRGVSPDDAYKTIGHSVNKMLWEAYLKYTPQQRKRMAQASNVTPEMYSKGMDDTVRRVAVEMRLRRVIDLELSTSDPTYRAYLQDLDARRSSPEHLDYMKLKVAAWWKHRLSGLAIVLNDPTLIKSCGIADMTGLEFVTTPY